MKICIFGNGFVGSTVAQFLISNTLHDITIVDPKYFDNDPINCITEADGIIICVPTPPGPRGSCDDRIVRTIVDMCDDSSRIMIKSSVTPSLIDKYEPNVVYCPEFLRQRHALEDFAKQTKMIIGHHENAEDQADWWIDIFFGAFQQLEFIKTDRVSASLVKYIHNSWLATKVVFFHSLYENMPEGGNFEHITDILAGFENIGPSHMKAPNEDGELGYGGACFPKDVTAILKDLNHPLLSFVDKINKEWKYT